MKSSCYTCKYFQKKLMLCRCLTNYGLSDMLHFIRNRLHPNHISKPKFVKLLSVCLFIGSWKNFTECDFWDMIVSECPVTSVMVYCFNLCQRYILFFWNSLLIQKPISISLSSILFHCVLRHGRNHIPANDTVLLTAVDDSVTSDCIIIMYIVPIDRGQCRLYCELVKRIHQRSLSTRNVVINHLCRFYFYAWFGNLISIIKRCLIN